MLPFNFTEGCCTYMAQSIYCKKICLPMPPSCSIRYSSSDDLKIWSWNFWMYSIFNRIESIFHAIVGWILKWVLSHDEISRGMFVPHTSHRQRRSFHLLYYEHIEEEPLWKGQFYCIWLSLHLNRLFIIWTMDVTFSVRGAKKYTNSLWSTDNREASFGRDPYDF